MNKHFSDSALAILDIDQGNCADYLILVESNPKIPFPIW